MPIEPSDVEVIRRAIESRLSDVHTSGPGKVTSYDPGTQTATVQPMWKRLTPSDADGVLESERFPEIKNVPILFPRSKKVGFDFDLEAGDFVLLLCPERNPAEWRQSGLESAPGDARLHPLAGAVGLPGYYPNDISAPLMRLRLTPEGFSVGPAPQPVALAPLVLAIFSALKAAIATAAATETGASGLGGMTALNGALSSWPGPAPQSTTLKATP